MHYRAANIIDDISPTCLNSRPPAGKELTKAQTSPSGAQHAGDFWSAQNTFGYKYCTVGSIQTHRQMHYSDLARHQNCH